MSANIGPCSYVHGRAARIPGDGLVIEASNVVLNCAGHSISGVGADFSDGISVWEGLTGVTVKNCNVTRFDWGFFLYNSSGHTFTGNTADNNSYGFRIYASSNSTFNGNTADNDTFDGFALYNSTGDNFTGNTADNDTSFGFELSNSSSSILAKNTADGNNAGIYLGNSSNTNAINGNTANNNTGIGFYIYDSSHNTLTANTANDNELGLALFGSNSSTLIANTADNNRESGFTLSALNAQHPVYIIGGSSNDTSSDILTENTANGNLIGFDVFATSNNSLTGNIANNNTKYGYYDSTAGSGTAGTANFYSGDECNGNGFQGSSPSGLGATP